MSGTLILGNDGGGPRHYLDGQPIHCGTGLELRLPSGKWIPARYEATLISAEEVNVRLFVVPWGEDGPEAMIAYPESYTLRWPVRDSVRSK